MTELARKRPIFHSEADFQRALAWLIQRRYPECAVRLERKPPGADRRIYVDIWLRLGGRTIALELKYKTRALTVVENGEEFALLGQGAQDIGRYDFCKDIERLQRVVEADPTAVGYAVMLTNDSSYWKAPRSMNCAYRDFCLDEGRELSGFRSWGETAGAGTMRGREAPIRIAGTQRLSWRDYSTVAETSSGRFRYLLLPVPPRTVSNE